MKMRERERESKREKEHKKFSMNNSRRYRRQMNEQAVYLHTYT